MKEEQRQRPSVEQIIAAAAEKNREEAADD